jgi:hypothetical protein
MNCEVQSAPSFDLICFNTIFHGSVSELLMKIDRRVALLSPVSNYVFSMKLILSFIYILCCEEDVVALVGTSFGPLSLSRTAK